MNDERTPVIVGVGELADRPMDLTAAREPIELMAEALRLAEADAGVSLVRRIDALDIINEVSWPYRDPCDLLQQRLGVTVADCTYHPVGGQSPMLAIHRAALAIQAGTTLVAAVCGAEAQATVNAARRTAGKLDWVPQIPDFTPVRGAAYQQEVARSLDLATPAHVYPFYENATRAAWKQTFADAQAESGMIWANNATIARDRASAWIKQSVTAADIAKPSPDNRMIAWPYTKLMMANPSVNQGAAVILCSLALARKLGVDEQRLIYPIGGAAADEPRDYLARSCYYRAPAMEWVLDRSKQLSEAGAFDQVELYSCFPTVPKMARRALGLPADRALTVAGGLTFFGAPLNNYMTHATVAMVHRLRGARGTGLLYGQGEYVTKHHAVVLSSDPAREPLAADYRRPDIVITEPALTQDHVGPAQVETFTILFDRAGHVHHGGAILRSPSGSRLLARIPQDAEATIAALMTEEKMIGQVGQVGPGQDGIPEWRLV